MNTATKVTLFVQCLVDGLYPEVGEALLAVFNKLGIPVDCPPDQTCCGQPAFNAGHRSAARTAARHFIETFEHAEVIVCPSGSCVHMVKHHYPELFAARSHWRRRAQRIGHRIYEFTQYLVDVLGIDNLGSRYRGKVTYHDACHLLRGLGVADQPRRLIRGIAGVELVEMKDSDYCCGFGGTFSVKYPAISTAMVDDKISNIVASGAQVVTGCDISCLMNIQGRLSRRGSAIQVLHIAQLLAKGIT